ncbi:ricin-type beta-trefoil lectin domain protein [Streptomyces avermitilis]|uniref:ricin-type beta-trefoil lectin domain protein n=1 Tax=Streptomyces avermitilis TaxID=33903 RepID=UPI0033F4AEC1
MNDGVLSNSPDPAASHEVTDEQLAAELKKFAGKRTVHYPVSELLARHWEEAFSYARLCTDGAHPAGMLTTAAFTRLFEEAARQGGPTAAWRPQLLVAIRRIAAEWDSDHRRSLLHPELRSGSGATGRAAARLLPPENRRLVSRAFQRLTEPARCVLWHTQVEGEGIDVPAALLGLDVDSAAVKLERAREQLREGCLDVHREFAAGDECRRYARLLDVSLRRGDDALDPDLSDHMAGCAHCRCAAEQLNRFYDRLPLLLAEGVLGWGAREYLDSRGERAPGTVEEAAGLPAAAVAPPAVVADARMDFTADTGPGRTADLPEDFTAHAAPDFPAGRTSAGFGPDVPRDFPAGTGPGLTVGTGPGLPVVTGPGVTAGTGAGLTAGTGAGLTAGTGPGRTAGTPDFVSDGPDFAAGTGPDDSADTARDLTADTPEDFATHATREFPAAGTSPGFGPDVPPDVVADAGQDFAAAADARPDFASGPAEALPHAPRENGHPHRSADPHAPGHGGTAQHPADANPGAGPSNDTGGSARHASDAKAGVRPSTDTAGSARHAAGPGDGPRSARAVPATGPRSSRAVPPAGARSAHKARRRALRRRRHVALAVLTVSACVLVPLTLWSGSWSGGGGTAAGRSSGEPGTGTESGSSGSLPWVGAAAATPSGTVQGRIRNADSGLCIGISKNKAVAGAETVLADCTESVTQRWEYETDGLLRSLAAPELCLDSHLGYSVQLAACAGESQPGTKNVRYDFTLQGSLVPRWNQDLALTSASGRPGAALVLKPRTDSESQRWQVDTSNDLEMQSVNWGIGSASTAPATRSAKSSPTPAPADTPTTGTPKSSPSTGSATSGSGSGGWCSSCSSNGQGGWSTSGSSGDFGGGGGHGGSDAGNGGGRG